jgi:hypothetical protein
MLIIYLLINPDYPRTPYNLEALVLTRLIYLCRLTGVMSQQLQYLSDVSSVVRFEFTQSIFCSVAKVTAVPDMMGYGSHSYIVRI